MRQAARRTRAQAARAGARGLSARASLGHPRLVELGCAEPASGAPSGNVDMYMLPSMSKCLRAGIQRPVTDAWRRRAAARAHGEGALRRRAIAGFGMVRARGARLQRRQARCNAQGRSGSVRWRTSHALCAVCPVMRHLEVQWWVRAPARQAASARVMRGALCAGGGAAHQLVHVQPRAKACREHRVIFSPCALKRCRNACTQCAR